MILLDDFDIADSLGDAYCPLMSDGIHCEHWCDGEACCRCGAPPDPNAYDEADDGSKREHAQYIAKYEKKRKDIVARWISL